MVTSRLARALLSVLLLVGLMTGATLIAGCADDADTPEADQPIDDAETGTDDAEPADEAEDEGDIDQADTDAPETLTVFVYFGTGENAFAVERVIPYTQATAAAAMEQLLMGPSQAEMEIWPLLATAIPDGTELLGVSIADGTALVDLSNEFDDGGGTFSVTMRVAQVVYTLTQFDTVDAVEFYMDGEKVDVFTGEGLMLDEPQTPEDYYQLVPIDA